MYRIDLTALELHHLALVLSWANDLYPGIKGEPQRAFSSVLMKIMRAEEEGEVYERSI